MAQVDLYVCGTFEVNVSSDAYSFAISSNGEHIATLVRPYLYLGLPADRVWQVWLLDGSKVRERGFWGIDSALQALRHHRQEKACKVTRHTVSD